MAAKDVILERSRQAFAWAAERFAEFRAESPYFQAKVGIVFVYAIIVLVTIVLVPPSVEPWQARQERISFGLSFKTALEITNVKNGDLDNVTLEVQGESIEFDGRKIAGTWTTKPLDLPEGERVKILTEQLYDARGVNPSFSLDVRTVRVLDEKTKLVVELTPALVKPGAAEAPE